MVTHDSPCSDCKWLMYDKLEKGLYSEECYEGYDDCIGTAHGCWRYEEREDDDE